MEREKVLSVGPPGPGASIYLQGQVRCCAHAHFLVPVCSQFGTFFLFSSGYQPLK